MTFRITILNDKNQLVSQIADKGFNPLVSKLTTEKKLDGKTYVTIPKELKPVEDPIKEVVK